MKIHLIKQQTIIDFAKKHSSSISAFEDWILKTKVATWQNFNDIKKTFNTADVLGKSSNRVVFDINGNHYRMICKVAFGEKNTHVFVCWIGTHAQYDKLCNKGDQYTINIY
jgi:mRNA interferase HigB